jgi:hypothetical protein
MQSLSVFTPDDLVLHEGKALQIILGLLATISKLLIYTCCCRNNGTNHIHQQGYIL